MMTRPNALPPDPSVPPDPKVLKQAATSYHYSSKIPLSIWVRTASRLLKHAQSYASQQVLDEAFVLFMRFIDLFAFNLYRHPDLPKAKAEYQLRPNSKDGKAYREYLELRANLPQLMAETEKLNIILEEKYEEYVEMQSRSRELAEAREHERSLRDAEKESRRKQRAIPVKVPQDMAPDQDADLARKLRALSVSTPSVVSSYNRIPVMTYPPPPTVVIDGGVSKPALPAKPEIAEQIDETPKEIVHKAVNSTEGGSPLRTVFLPSRMIQDFLEIAGKNTEKGLETCGLLCGKLNRNAFFVTYLVIPEQESTPNTCNTKNEERLFEVIDNLDLFILGWIHTHPTQSCFLSSVDLHTQNSYQIMLNEAIAVVCAPSEKLSKKLGIFRLTDPPGIATITGCGRSGFHPHPEKNLYVECYRISKENAETGHVVIRKDLPYNVKDLR